MKCVIGQLEFGPKQNKKTGCHSYAQAQNIDKGKSLAFQKVAYGDGQVIGNHQR
jgi:hypothetical protein